jgi:hypothetical protein
MSVATVQSHRSGDPVLIDVLGSHYKATVITDTNSECLVRVTEGSVSGTYMTLPTRAVHEVVNDGVEALEPCDASSEA